MRAVEECGRCSWPRWTFGNARAPDKLARSAVCLASWLIKHNVLLSSFYSFAHCFRFLNYVVIYYVFKMLNLLVRKEMLEKICVRQTMHESHPDIAISRGSL